MSSNNPTDSSTTRKVSIPVVAGAITGLVVLALHIVNAPITEVQYGTGAPLLLIVSTVLLDIFAPSSWQ